MERQKEMWAAALAGVVLLAGPTFEPTLTSAARYPLEARDTIRRTLRWPAGAVRRVELSNLSGAVRVTGGNGDGVEVVIERVMHAENATAMSDAKRVSEPVMSESGQGISVRAAGELSGGCDDRRERGGGTRNRWSDAGYRVETPVEVRLPANVELRLCTVNGPATVSNIDGMVKVNAVNGQVEARDIGGAVDLQTVNGAITADVRARPERPWSLQTVNGDITLRMPSDTSADLRLKTLHGELLTNFDTTVMPSPSAATADSDARRGGRRVYRSNRTLGVRIGQGGPELALETFNGSVRVERRQ